MARAYTIIAIVVCFLIGGYILETSLAFGQTGSFNIVSTYTLEDTRYEGGDIVSFNPNTNSYSLSRIPNDKELYGVIQINPLVVFRTGDDRVPVAQSGELFVNVTTLQGDIRVGDYLTTSEIPGKGQRFDSEDGYVLGIALEQLNLDTSTNTASINGVTVAIGTITVLLSIGPFQDGVVVSGPPPSIIINEPVGKEGGIKASTAFRYILATIFAVVSLYLIFRNFGPNLKEGVISVGRNPLARSSIQSMVTFNMLLILIISIAALLVSLVIILLPI